MRLWEKKKSLRQRISVFYCMIALAAVFLLATPASPAFADTGPSLPGEVSTESLGDTTSDNDATSEDSTDSGTANEGAPDDSSGVNHDAQNTSETNNNENDGNENTSTENTTDETDTEENNTVDDETNTEEDNLNNEEEIIAEDNNLDENNDGENNNVAGENQADENTGNEETTEEDTPENENIQVPEPVLDTPEGLVPSLQDIINAALNAGTDNNTIYVDGGIYNEDLIIDASLEPYFNNMVISASGNGGIPVINGNVLFNGLSNFIFEGFQINGLITVQDSNNLMIAGTEEDDTLQVALLGNSSNITIDGKGGNDTLEISGSVNTAPTEGGGDGTPASGSSGGEGPPPDTGPGAVGVQVSGGSGDDHLIVDFGLGNPIPLQGLSYDGGDDYDVLTLKNGSFGTAHYQAINEDSGTITLDGFLVSYTNIEPIYHNGGTEQLIIDSTGGNNAETITIEYAGNVSNGVETLIQAIKIASASFETVFFTGIKDVTFNALGGDDTIIINLTQPAAGLTSLTIKGGDGNDTIRNNGQDILLADGADLSGGVDLILESEQILISGGTVRAKSIQLIAEDELTLNLDSPELPVAPVVAVKASGAKVLVDGDTTLEAYGEITLSARSVVTVVLKAKPVAAGTVTETLAMAVAVLENKAEALLQGSATANTTGKITIKAETEVNVRTISDGVLDGDSSGGISLAITKLDNVTKAGVYQNALTIPGGLAGQTCQGLCNRDNRRNQQYCECIRRQRQ